MVFYQSFSPVLITIIEATVLELILLQSSWFHFVLKLTLWHIIRCLLTIIIIKTYWKILIVLMNYLMKWVWIKFRNLAGILHELSPLSFEISSFISIILPLLEISRDNRLSVGKVGEYDADGVDDKICAQFISGFHLTIRCRELSEVQISYYDDTK